MIEIQSPGWGFEEQEKLASRNISYVLNGEINYIPESSPFSELKYLHAQIHKEVIGRVFGEW